MKQKFKAYPLSVIVHLLFGPLPCSYMSSNLGGPHITLLPFHSPFMLVSFFGAPHSPPVFVAVPPPFVLLIVAALLETKSGAMPSCFSLSSLPFISFMFGDAAPSVNKT